MPVKSKAKKPAAKKAAPAPKSTAAKALKYVYVFGKKTDGNGSMKALLGGKGANLAEMTRIGLPVPPGFTITTEVCTYYYANKRTYPAPLQPQIQAAIASMEAQMGTKFGDMKAMPLLVAVRSGARDSMPGMMDTILNLGLNDQTVVAVAKATGHRRFAWDCYRRFLPVYGDVVMGVHRIPSDDHDPRVTRDPAAGEKVFYGEFLMNAQGEDVVAGVRTPLAVEKLDALQPKAFAELEQVRKTLESHFKDVQDFEFTIQDGQLFMLQTRNGKRTGVAAVRFAVEMVDEKLIDWKTAIKRVPADQLDQVLAPIFDRKALAKATVIATGLPA